MFTLLNLAIQKILLCLLIRETTKKETRKLTPLLLRHVNEGEGGSDLSP